MPFISIIIPVYDVELYLHRCIDSILAQSLQDFELILVDDGSPDNSPAICNEYANRDSRIHVIHQKNGGLSAARNAGINWCFANSQSEWLTFVDSDDWIHPQMLQTLVEIGQKSQRPISACFYQQVSKECLFNYDFSCEYELISAEDFYVKFPVEFTIAVAKLYKKDLWGKIRFPDGKLHEDEYTTYKIVFPNSPIALLKLPLYFYFVNFAGITKSDWSPRKLDALTAIREQMSFFQKNGFNNAFSRSCMAYLFSLATQIEKIGKNHPALKKEIQKELRHAFLKYHKTAGISLHKDAWICQTAFPHLLRPYYLARKILIRLNKICLNVLGNKQ